MTGRTHTSPDAHPTLLADGDGKARLRKPAAPAKPEPEPEPQAPPPAPVLKSFDQWFEAAFPKIPLASAEATLKLAGEGATIPFMARYRKEQTRNLDEVGIQTVLSAKERWDRIVARQTFILGAVERQDKLTPELRSKILSAYDLDVLEDLYLPYKQKRKSKATLAREAGLGPLADWIWNCGHGTETPQPGQTLELWAYTFRNEELGVKDAETAVRRAQDILVERLAELPELRQLTRETTFRKGHVRTTKGPKAKTNSKYEKYFASHEPISTLLQPRNAHRYQAIRRGWTEKELSLAIGGRPDDEDYEAQLQAAFEAAACTVPDSPGAALLRKAARVALKSHVQPSIAAEVHQALKGAAEEVAIRVFAENLRNLLLASPFGPKAVLGIDPGQRTGSKMAVVDQSGTYLGSEVLHLGNDAARVKARELLAATLERFPVQAVAVGNGTAGRETEAFVREATKAQGLDIPVLLVNEAGASVYSASKVAREEFPKIDVTVRGAISIARRLQDPLAELVKIDPKSIGVGQYQHDIADSPLRRSLDQVVDSCVNQVGVNLNTASSHLLSHVAGIGPALAKAMVAHRASTGLFRKRAGLLEVPRFSKKSFEQAAGFLRIPGGDHPLDGTGVHPERYPALETLARGLGKDVGDLLGPGVEQVRDADGLRKELGAYTFEDVLKELEKPGRDPREVFVAFRYRDDVHELSDLKPGMKCPGIVTNVTNFGAFVDIGVHHDGLVHVSRLANRFVEDPRQVVRPGQRVEVRVVEVNLEKKQLALTMKSEPARKTRPAPARRERSQPDAPGPQAHKPQPRKDRPSKTRSESSPRHSTSSGRVPLNNPFAVLADLKKILKSRR
jgi:uncharacterized protein